MFSYLPTVLLQVSGMAANFLMVIIIARVFGPELQGQYAQIRSWVDLLGSVLCLGLPQALVIAINRHGTRASALSGRLGMYLLAVLPVAWLVTWIATVSGYAYFPRPTLGAVLLIGLAGVSAAFGHLWRGLYMASSAGPLFGLISALPSVTVLGAIGFAALTPVGDDAWSLAARTHFEWHLAIALLLAALLHAVLVQPSIRRRSTGAARPIQWRALLGTSMHGFIQLLAIVLFPLLLYAIIRLNGGSDTEVGILSTVLFLFQVLSAPIDLVSPILFSLWTRQAQTASLDAAALVLRRGVPWMLLATVPAMLAVYFFIPVFFGAAYEAARLPGAVVAASFACIFISRVCAPALFATGTPHITSWMWSLRLVATGILSVACIALVEGYRPLMIALAWLATEVAVAAVALVALRRQRARTHA